MHRGRLYRRLCRAQPAHHQSYCEYSGRFAINSVSTSSTSRGPKWNPNFIDGHAAFRLAYFEWWNHNSIGRWWSFGGSKCSRITWREHCYCPWILGHSFANSGSGNNYPNNRYDFLNDSNYYFNDRNDGSSTETTTDTTNPQQQTHEFDHRRFNHYTNSSTSETDDGIVVSEQFFEGQIRSTSSYLLQGNFRYEFDGQNIVLSLGKTTVLTRHCLTLCVFN